MVQQRGQLDRERVERWKKLNRHEFETWFWRGSVCKTSRLQQLQCVAAQQNQLVPHQDGRWWSSREWRHQMFHPVDFGWSEVISDGVCLMPSGPISLRQVSSPRRDFLPHTNPACQVCHTRSSRGSSAVPGGCVHGLPGRVVCEPSMCVLQCPMGRLRPHSRYHVLIRHLRRHALLRKSLEMQ